ncbi:14327_t:CDS:2, partial [Funneliformis geosporum]
ERDTLKAEIIRVSKILHDQNFVHGDLREGNILVCRNSTRDCGFDVKLIDFEWSGTVGTACYSHFMNHIAIRWPEGAEDGKKVTVEHNIMLEKTFQKTNLSQDSMLELSDPITQQIYSDSTISLQTFPDMDIDSVNFRELNDRIIEAEDDNKKIGLVLIHSYYYFGKGYRLWFDHYKKSYSDDTSNSLVNDKI